jgi:hypothetical protein
VRAGLSDRTPDRIARHARASGAVNTQDNGFHRRVFGGGLQGFDERFRAHEPALPERAFLALTAAYDAMGIDQGKLGGRCCLLLWRCEDFREELDEGKGVLHVDIGRLAAIIRHKLECVDAKVCLHASPKEVARSNRVNKAKGLQVGSR